MADPGGLMHKKMKKKYGKLKPGGLAAKQLLNRGKPRQFFDSADWAMTAEAVTVHATPADAHKPAPKPEARHMEEDVVDEVPDTGLPEEEEPEEEEDSGGAGSAAPDPSK